MQDRTSVGIMVHLFLKFAEIILELLSMREQKLNKSKSDFQELIAKKDLNLFSLFLMKFVIIFKVIFNLVND